LIPAARRRAYRWHFHGDTGRQTALEVCGQGPANAVNNGLPHVGNLQFFLRIHFGKKFTGRMICVTVDVSNDDQNLAR
jgi:hypothetical protein